jgi:WD40 repeat protein
MKMIAVLAMSVVGVIIFPAASFLHARNREWAGSQFRQDAQPKKASFTNPVLELEIKYESGVTAIAFSPDSKILAIGADDYTTQLCDTRTGQSDRTSLESPSHRWGNRATQPDACKPSVFCNRNRFLT